MATNGAASSPLPLLINNEEVITDKHFPVTSPTTSATLWHASGARKSEAISAVSVAAAALPSWSRTTPSERRDVLLRAASIMESSSADLSAHLVAETGGDDTWAGFNVSTTVEMLRDCAGRIAGAVEGVVPACAEAGRTAMVVKEPFGVVLSIAPWNAPYILGMRSVMYPLAAGNTCVLKGAEAAPRCFVALGRVLREAGLPAGCLNVVFAAPEDAAEVTEALIAAPEVKKVNFTGSTAVGSIIAQTAGKYIKPVLMELGGKAPTIVMPDADLDKAAMGCVLGSFLYAGQICMSTERIVVHSSIKDEFAETMNATLERVFDPNAEAPVMISSAGMAKTKKLVEDALAAGAKVVGGTDKNDENSKTRMRPIVIDGVTKEMDIYYTESFGPSVSLITYDEEEEAIAIANDTKYGLSASVYTKDLLAGLRVAKQIESGAVHINNMTVHDEPRLPHGGAKSSGFGRFGGSWGLDEFLRTKTITFGA